MVMLTTISGTNVATIIGFGLLKIYLKRILLLLMVVLIKVVLFIMVLSLTIVDSVFEDNKTGGCNYTVSNS